MEKFRPSFDEGYVRERYQGFVDSEDPASYSDHEGYYVAGARHQHGELMADFMELEAKVQRETARAERAEDKVRMLLATSDRYFHAQRQKREEADKRFAFLLAQAKGFPVTNLTVEALMKIKKKYEKPNEPQMLQCGTGVEDAIKELMLERDWGPTELPNVGLGTFLGIRLEVREYMPKDMGVFLDGQGNVVGIVDLRAKK